MKSESKCLLRLIKFNILFIDHVLKNPKNMGYKKPEDALLDLRVEVKSLFDYFEGGEELPHQKVYVKNMSFSEMREALVGFRDNILTDPEA